MGVSPYSNHRADGKCNAVEMILKMDQEYIRTIIYDDASSLDKDVKVGAVKYEF